MSESGRETTRARVIEQRLGEKLKRCRERKGFSQMDVGIAVGISQSQVGRYERGERPLPVAHLVQLAELFEQPVSYFLDHADRLDATASEAERERHELLVQARELLYEQDGQTLAALVKLMARD